MTYNKIHVQFGKLRKITWSAINYRYDVTQYLVIDDLTLPQYYQVDFCNKGDRNTITMTNTENGVQIPDELLLTGKDIKAFIVLQGEDAGAVETRYEITFPINNRPEREDIDPTPAQESQINALVTALNEAVTTSEANANGAGQASDMSRFYSQISEGYAQGTWIAEPNPFETINAKYYSEQAADSAEVSERWAKLSEQSAGASGWVYFYIDEDGYLHYVKTENCDLDFYIDNEGFLHVTNGEA